MLPQSLLRFAAGILGLVSLTQAVPQKPILEYISYTSVPGFFLQDSNTTNPSTFDFVSTNTHFQHPLNKQMNFPRINSDVRRENMLTVPPYRLPRISVSSIRPTQLMRNTILQARNLNGRDLRIMYLP
jgi:hypothetical protein